jgi:hypothetical protein
MFRRLLDYLQEETTDENSDLYSSVVSAWRLSNQFRSFRYTYGVVTISLRIRPLVLSRRRKNGTETDIWRTTVFISSTEVHHTLDKDVKEEHTKKNEKGKEQTGKENKKWRRRIWWNNSNTFYVSLYICFPRDNHLSHRPKGGVGVINQLRLT